MIKNNRLIRKNLTPSNGALRYNGGRSWKVDTSKKPTRVLPIMSLFHPGNWYLNDYSDYGSFSNAFYAARSNKELLFVWNNKNYTTALKEDLPQTLLQTLQQQTPKLLQSVNTIQLALLDFSDRIKRVENSKTNPQGGYDKSKNVWKPHDSAEGGSLTVGYGIKLSANPDVLKLITKQGGYLTDALVEDALSNMASRFYNKTKSVYDGKFGVGNFEKLNPYIRSMLMDYEYNVKGGLATYPKLMEAVYNGDLQGILDNYKRNFTDASGVKRPLARNKDIEITLQALQNGDYSILM